MTDIVNGKIILTCFAGRESCMKILLKYVDALLKKGIIDEFHAWNFTRQHNDERWLKNLFGLIDANINYVSTQNILSEFNPITLYVKTSNDAHIKLNAIGIEKECCEIVIGGWNNTRNVIRNECQGVSFMENNEILLNDKSFIKINLRLKDSTIIVDVQDKYNILRLPIDKNIKQLNISVAGWNNKCEWNVSQDYSKMKLMNVEKKSLWGEYYKYYTKEKFIDCIITKCDDDIIYIDLESYKRHLELRKLHKNYLLLFPAIWNNEMVAYYQQKNGLIPIDTVGEMHGEPTGYGSLWGDGPKCQRLHHHFIKNYDITRQKSKDLNTIIDVPMNYRVSVNFFSILSKDLDVFQQVGNDDERDLTQVLPGKWNRQVGIDMGHIVSHLSFGQQVKTGLDTRLVLSWYDEISRKII
jgi:hypothetical protein